MVWIDLARVELWVWDIERIGIFWSWCASVLSFQRTTRSKVASGVNGLSNLDLYELHDRT